MAVASAIVTARCGSPRAEPTAEMVAAFAACSGEISYGCPPSAARTEQRGAPGPPVTYCTRRYTPSPTSTAKAAPARRRRLPRVPREGAEDWGDTQPTVLEGRR